MNIPESTISIHAVKLLRDVGVPANLLGYEYSKQALMILLETPNAISHVTSAIYPEVAKRFGTTASRVERAIRHAVESMFIRIDPDVYLSKFGSTVRMDKGKLSNSEFLGILVENLRVELGVYGKTYQEPTETNNNLRPCLVHGKYKALFHRWEDKAEIVPPSNLAGGHDGGVVRAVLAIVELEDGKIEEVYPENITFLDTNGAMAEFDSLNTEEG